MLGGFLSTARSGDSFVQFAYLNKNPAYAETLELIRRKLRHTFKLAVTLGFGPRFLHSTGQLHKGGPNSGVYIQITVADHANQPIPEAPYGPTYGFSELKQAQAPGDMQSLQE